MKHTIKLLTLAAILTAVFGLTGCPGPVNNYIEPEYTITVNEPEHGVVETDKTLAKVGETVTLTITPNSSYELDSLTVNEVALSGEGNTRTFTMPAENVVINVTFKAVTVDDGNSDGDEEPEQTTPEGTTDEEETPTDDGNNDDTESGDGDTETNNGNGDEEPQYTYTHGGCDANNCPPENRYEYPNGYKFIIVNGNTNYYFSFNPNDLTSYENIFEQCIYEGELTGYYVHVDILTSLKLEFNESSLKWGTDSTYITKTYTDKYGLPIGNNSINTFYVILE